MKILQRNKSRAKGNTTAPRPTHKGDYDPRLFLKKRYKVEIQRNEWKNGNGKKAKSQQSDTNWSLLRLQLAPRGIANRSLFFVEMYLVFIHTCVLIYYILFACNALLFNPLSYRFLPGLLGRLMACETHCVVSLATFLWLFYWSIINLSCIFSKWTFVYTLFFPQGVPSSGGARLERHTRGTARCAHHSREHADRTFTDLHTENLAIKQFINYNIRRIKSNSFSISSSQRLYRQELL